MQDIVKYRKVLERLIDEGQELKILTLISRLHPDDIASLIDDLEEDQKSRLFRLLDVETAADVIMELDGISRELIVEDIPDEKLTEIVDDMPTDDAADFIAELPEDQAQRLLSRIDQDKSEDVQRLLEYPEDSAGGIMQTELVALGRDTTVTRAIEHIRSRRDELENVHNVYALDDESRLVGVVPLSSLLFADGETPLKDIMDKQVVVAAAGMDQEEVAALFRKYDLVSLPVVDDGRHILGRILVDDIIEVIEEEVSEDMFRMAGISEEEDVVYSGPTFKVCMTRLPWLVFNFFGTLVSGYFLWLYQSKLTEMLALLAFVPVICAMSGNIGVQSTSIVIRGIATGRVDFSNLRKLVFKESAVGLLIGLVCGVLGGVIGFVWQSSWLIGIVVFVAMFIAISFGALLGVLVPLFFKKIKIDPAVASGSLIATTNDLVAINIYFLFAAFMMRCFFTA